MALALLAAVGVSLGAWLQRPQPLDDPIIAENGQCTAQASTWRAMRIFGSDKLTYRFTVQDRGSAVSLRWEIPVPIERLATRALRDCLFNPNGRIVWASDASAVTFFVQDVEVSRQVLGDSQAASWTAALPDGSIELVALSHHPSQGQPWWCPDGSPWLKAPFENVGSTSTPGSDEKAFEFVFHTANLPEDASAPQFKFDPTASWAGGAVRINGERVRDYQLVSATPPKSLKKVTVRVGIATGPWETIVQREPKGSGTTSLRHGNIDWQVNFLEPVERADQSTVVNVSFTKADCETRIVAVDQDDQELTPGRSGQSGLRDYNQLTATFSNLPLKRIKELRFQARPYHWVEFKNVALKLGMPGSALRAKDGRDKLANAPGSKSPDLANFQSITPYPTATLTLGWDGSRVSYPDLMAYLKHVRQTAEYQTWLGRRNVRDFTETNNAGYRFVAHLLGLGDLTDEGTKIELISAIDLYRPDRSRLATLALGTSDADRFDTKVFDETGTNVIVRLHWARSELSRKHFIERVFHNPGTSEEQIWSANRFGVVYSARPEHHLPEFEDAPYPEQ